jgi:hypothetical protein
MSRARRDGPGAGSRGKETQSIELPPRSSAAWRVLLHTVARRGREQGSWKPGVVCVTNCATQDNSGRAQIRLAEPEGRNISAADTEMRILEASIDKISELLAVAFGDAGVDIIAENMRNMGGLNPMVPGQRTVRCAPRRRGAAQQLCSNRPTGRERHSV